MPKIKRVGVTFPPDLLKDFDEVINSMGYENRSKAVQDAVRLFVTEQKLLQNESGDQAGFMMMLYDHQASGLENKLTHVQHHFSHIICSTLHVHLTDTDCLEAIALRGNTAEVRKLRNQLAAQKGVKLLKVTIFSV
jgi:CopG family nickel-responsive transcriptional regulator